MSVVAPFARRCAALILLAVSTGVGRWMIAARLESLRIAMGRPIDEVPLDDALRVAFNNLHGYSVGVMLVGIIAAIATLLLARRRSS
ncbi:MAG: hypothetical protein WKF84_14520 [Pyrinomonadaceae bacterium]